VPIDEKDLLQAKATIIAGILILVTISSIGETFPALEASTETKGIAENPFAYNVLARIFIIAALVPFVMSIVTLIRMKDNDKKERKLQIVKKSTMIGALYIVGVVVFLLLVLPYSEPF
jgi:hypothetical protein